MIDKIIESALRQKFLVVVFAVVLIAYGVHSTLKLNVRSGTGHHARLPKAH